MKNAAAILITTGVPNTSAAVSSPSLSLIIAIIPPIAEDASVNNNAVQIKGVGHIEGVAFNILLLANKMLCSILSRSSVYEGVNRLLYHSIIIALGSLIRYFWEYSSASLI